jgi:branched-chain amino acid transport system substrate-binding protein
MACTPAALNEPVVSGDNERFHPTITLKLRKALRGALVSASVLAVVLGLAADLARAQQEKTQQEKILKIGVLGVMRGPAASWGLVNKYSAETTAQMYNEKGGVDIGGEKYKIQIVAIDDQLDPKLAVAGAERLIRQEGIRYIIGPNVDTTAAVVVPLLRAGNAIDIPYAFASYLYTPPQRNSILGMVASYQVGPIIYRYLKDKRGIKAVSFVARNEADSLNQRDQGVIGAMRVGLTVVSSSEVYEPGTTNFRPVMARVLKGADAGLPQAGQVGGAVTPVGGTPDLIVLAGVAPGDAPLILIALRELGYKGLVSAETAQDAKLLGEAGAAAEGFISVGGASPPETRSPYMEEFVRRYTKLAGEWHDEAGTKVYALEMILRTLQKAGPKAINDVAEFMNAIPTFDIDNPFVKEKTTLRYVGTTFFNQQRQIGVPLVVNEFKGGKFHTLFVGSVE